MSPVNRGIDWPPALLELPEDAWTMTDTGPQVRIKVNGYALTLTGLAVREVDGVQTAVEDPAREELLLSLYDPEEPWQTWRGFDAEYALYAVPAADQDAPAEVCVDVTRAAWAGFVPEFEERDRKLVTVVVAGHCALHLEARRVVGEDQEFAAYPEDREPLAELAELAGWVGPFPTVRIYDDTYVLFAYPHGE